MCMQAGDAQLSHASRGKPLDKHDRGISVLKVLYRLPVSSKSGIQLGSRPWSVHMPCIRERLGCLLDSETTSRDLASNDEASEFVSVLLEIDKCCDVVEIANTASRYDWFVHERDSNLESLKVRWLHERVPSDLGNHKSGGST